METITPQGVLLLLALFQIKHALGDGPLQTIGMVKEKGFYGQPGGLYHAGIHGLGSLIALLVFGMAALPALLLATAEAALHYHIDFTKESMGRRNGWTQDKPTFWWALMGDQMMHQLTYLAIALVVISIS
jgi:hypothetical protein